MNRANAPADDSVLNRTHMQQHQQVESDQPTSATPAHATKGSKRYSSQRQRGSEGGSMAGVTQEVAVLGGVNERESPPNVQEAVMIVTTTSPQALQAQQRPQLHQQQQQHMVAYYGE